MMLLLASVKGHSVRACSTDSLGWPHSHAALSLFPIRFRYTPQSMCPVLSLVVRVRASLSLLGNLALCLVIGVLVYCWPTPLCPLLLASVYSLSHSTTTSFLDAASRYAKEVKAARSAGSPVASLASESARVFPLRNLLGCFLQ